MAPPTRRHPPGVPAPFVIRLRNGYYPSAQNSAQRVPNVVRNNGRFFWAERMYATLDAWGAEHQIEFAALLFAIGVFIVFVILVLMRYVLSFF